MGNAHIHTHTFSFCVALDINMHKYSKLKHKYTPTHVHAHTHTHARTRKGGAPPARPPPNPRANAQTHRHRHTHTHAHTHTHTHAELLTKALIARASQKTTKRRGVAYQNRSTLEQLCLSAAIWFPSPCLFVDATRCMSRTVIDGPKRCPRLEGLTNQLLIKLHPL